MTVIGVVQRPTFVVVGADSSVSGPAGLREDRLRKFVVHEHLPLAFATAGLSDCAGPSGARGRVVDALTEFGAGLERIESLDAVYGALTAAFDTSFARALRLGGSRAVISVYVALVRDDGTTEAGAVNCTRDGWKLEPAARGAIFGGTEAAMSVVRDRGTSEGWFTGVDDPDRVAELLRGLLFDCIEAEEADNGSEACGPPVDIVLVDRRGARLLSSSMRRNEVTPFEV